MSQVRVQRTSSLTHNRLPRYHQELGIKYMKKKQFNYRLPFNRSETHLVCGDPDFLIANLGIKVEEATEPTRTAQTIFSGIKIYKSSIMPKGRAELVDKDGKILQVFSVS